MRDVHCGSRRCESSVFLTITSGSREGRREGSTGHPELGPSMKSFQHPIGTLLQTTTLRTLAPRQTLLKDDNDRSYSPTRPNLSPVLKKEDPGLRTLSIRKWERGGRYGKNMRHIYDITSSVSKVPMLFQMVLHSLSR